jgi:hypothetical protein
VLNTLVDGKYREIARLTETPVFIDPLQIGQNTNIPIGPGPNAVDKIGAGKVQPLLGNFGRMKFE